MKNIQKSIYEKSLAPSSHENMKVVFFKVRFN